MDKQEKKEPKVVDYENDRVYCRMCGRWMKVLEFDNHYGRCLDIQYLESKAKEMGEKFTREDLENCKEEIIDKLLQKYPPKGVEDDYPNLFR